MSFERKEIAHTLGYRIRRFRVEKNMSQEALAFSAGVHSTYIGKIERGEKCPTVDTLYKIAKGLDVSVGDLLDIPNVKPSEYSSTSVRINAAISKLCKDEIDELADIIEKIVSFKRK